MPSSKTLIGGTVYDIKGGKTLIGGTGYDIKKGRTLIGGTEYDISFGTPLGELAVKTSVYMNVDGVRTEWKVAHQGIPDATIYDASCNGTWLLMKDIYLKTSSGSSTNNAYASSAFHTYLNGTFLELLDADIKGAVKQVIIPYSSSIGRKLYTGASGLSTRAFLLSAHECGSSDTIRTNAEGAALDYFTSSNDRIAYLDGTAQSWVTRSPNTANSTYYWGINTLGEFTVITVSSSASISVRPVVIFDSEKVLADGDFNIMIA